MGTAQTPPPVKLITSAFAPSDTLLQSVRNELEHLWGPVDFESDLLPFDHTSYYTPEFGPNLVRRIWSFHYLISPSTLAAIKTLTNTLEQRWTENGQRRVNLDPGYVSTAKLVLATTKNHGHRIYLRDGIYAEVTLQYRNKAFHPWPWTYPDYASEPYLRLFEQIRAHYIEQLAVWESPPEGRKRVLFLCTGNSARSQMAEGLTRHFLGDRWEAFSAGTEPTGYVHPLATRAVAELGIEISHYRSKHVDEFLNQAFDTVITVCDNAAQNCPVWLGKGKQTHIGFPDPAAATGSEEERLEVFRKVRDGLREQILSYLESFDQPGKEKEVTFYAPDNL